MSDTEESNNSTKERKKKSSSTDSFGSGFFEEEFVDMEIEKVLADNFSEQCDIEVHRSKSSDNLKPDQDSMQVSFSGSYTDKERLVLVKKGFAQCPLPEGWQRFQHDCGMIVYIHKETRTCTLSKPYSLGDRHPRSHDIPLSAVPCLHYKKELERETDAKMQKDSDESGDAPSPSFDSMDTSSSAEEIQEEMLKPQEVTEYCRRLFQFKVVKERCFKSRKLAESSDESNRYIGNDRLRVKIPKQFRSRNRGRRVWHFDPRGRTYTEILHDYIRQVTGKPPSYEQKENEKPPGGYSVVVIICDIRYGVGFGSTKKEAKTEAAKATLQILMPKTFDKCDSGDEASVRKAKYLRLFDQMKINDRRCVDMLCRNTNAAQPTPHSMLKACLARNADIGQIKIMISPAVGRIEKHQEKEVTMNVGPYSATVLSRNKDEGKQLTSQAILTQLHPIIDKWGSLMRLYWSLFENAEWEEQQVGSSSPRRRKHTPLLEKIKQQIPPPRVIKQSKRSKKMLIDPKPVSTIDFPLPSTSKEPDIKPEELEWSEISPSESSSNTS